MSAQIETQQVTEPVTVGAPEMAAEIFPWRQWAGILAGGVAGFGLTIILATLGLAIGVTTEPVASTTLAVGSAIWWLLAVSIVGFGSGALVGSILSPRSMLASMLLSFLVWCTGTTILLLMISIGAGSFLGGMGSYLSWIAQDPGVYVSPAEAQRAHTISAAALWVLLASQLLGIGMTFFGIQIGAKARRKSAALPRRTQFE